MTYGIVTTHHGATYDRARPAISRAQASPVCAMYRWSCGMCCQMPIRRCSNVGPSPGGDGDYRRPSAVTMKAAAMKFAMRRRMIQAQRLALKAL